MAIKFSSLGGAGTPIDVKLAAGVVPTMTGSVGRVTATVAVPAGTYLAYQSGSTGTTWTVNGISVSAPTGQSSVVSFTTTGSSFIVDYTPGSQLTWSTLTTTPKVFFGSDIPLVYGGGKYLAFTGNISNYWSSYIYVSTNGSDWNRNAYVADGTDSPRILAYNTTATVYKYVMTTNRKMFGSTDGQTWNNTFNDSPSPEGMYQACFSDTGAWKYVLGISGGYCVVSTSGASWTTRNVTSSGGCLAMGGGNSGSLFMFFGNITNGGYATSTDSVTWTGRSTPGLTDEIRWAGYVNSKYWCSGYDGLFSSTDAITWTLVATNAKAIASITYKNSAYWAVDNYQTYGSNAKKIWKSTDGITWTVVASTDKTVGLLDDGNKLITWSGSFGLSIASETTSSSKIYISSTGVGLTPNSGQITLTPLTSTPVTAS